MNRPVLRTPRALAEAGLVDPAQLPRWGVVLMGDSKSPTDDEVLPRKEWSAPQVARFFRAAAMIHDLRRRRIFNRDHLANSET